MVSSYHVLINLYKRRLCRDIEPQAGAQILRNLQFQFNSIYLLIRQTCWYTTKLHKMKS